MHGGSISATCTLTALTDCKHYSYNHCRWTGSSVHTAFLSHIKRFKYSIYLLTSTQWNETLDYQRWLSKTKQDSTDRPHYRIAILILTLWHKNDLSVSFAPEKRRNTGYPYFLSMNQTYVGIMIRIILSALKQAAKKTWDESFEMGPQVFKQWFNPYNHSVFMWDKGKQCRHRSEAALCGVWSGSPLIPLENVILELEYKNKKYHSATLKTEMGWSNRYYVGSFIRLKFEYFPCIRIRRIKGTCIWAATWYSKQCDICDQRRLRPACAYAQTDSEPLLVA